MKWDMDAVLEEMAEAVNKAVEDDLGDISEYGTRILENEKESLQSLAQARLSGQIDDQVFLKEIEREKKVVRAELLTIEIMSKACAQKALNAAFRVFQDAVQTALKTAV